MSDDLLKNIRTKIKPAVQNREASLNSAILDNSQSINTEIHKSENQDNLNSVSLDTSTSGILENEIPENLGSENYGDVESGAKAQALEQVSTKQAEQELEVKQSTLRLEAGVSERLQALCREKGICREVLIEAMFEYCEINSKALSKILESAKKKNENRQKIANRRRAKSMIQKFG